MGGYTPVFSEVFSGSLCGQYPDTAAWLFLLALADKYGHVDKTPQYISAITGMPVDTLMECIARFMEPDPSSRSGAHEGRRLVLIDPKRGWGWRIVNHGAYREKARQAARESERVETGENKQRMRQRTFQKVGRNYTYGEWCRYCGCEATGVDHIDCDGPDTPENTVPCCQRCNTSKHRRDLLTFLNSCEWIDPEVVMKDEILSGLVTWSGMSFDPVLPPIPPDDRPSDTDTDTDKDLRNTTAASRPTRANGKHHEPPEFAEIRALYPKRGGSQPWAKAMKAVSARRKEGATWTELIDGVRRYAIFVRETGKEGTEYVLQASTFFGPDRRYLEPWEKPASKADSRYARNIKTAQDWAEGEG